MAEVTLNINGRHYGIACDDGQEDRVRDLGAYIDARVREIAGAGAGTTESHLLVLASLVLADEIFDLRETLQSAAQSAGPGPAITGEAGEGVSLEEQDKMREAIHHLASRIDSIADRLMAA